MDDNLARGNSGDDGSWGTNIEVITGVTTMDPHARCLVSPPPPALTISALNLGAAGLWHVPRVPELAGGIQSWRSHLTMFYLEQDSHTLSRKWLKQIWSCKGLDFFSESPIQPFIPPCWLPPPFAFLLQVTWRRWCSSLWQEMLLLLEPFSTLVLLLPSIR